MFLLDYLFCSMVCAAGMAIILTEKRFEWPVRRINLALRWHLRKIHPNLSKLPQCAVCSAFWTTILTDLSICLFSHGNYFMWPLSGFAAAGFVWFLMDFLSVVESLRSEE